MSKRREIRYKIRGEAVPFACDSIAPAAPIRQQRKGRPMSKRSGQSGSVRLVGSKWYGRYWRDVQGKTKREHPSVVLGEKSEMTKPEAKRKLMDIIVKGSVNTPEHLIQPGGMHAFRHGRVSQLQASGVPADFTKSQVGHSTLRTTSGYTHFTDAFKRETVERLASKLMFCTRPA